MWVKREDYILLRTQLAAQSATIEWLRNDWNRLTRENAELKDATLGIPATRRVPQIDRADPALVALPKAPTAARPGADTHDPPSMQDLVAGNVSFEDMGDAEAVKAGADWDPDTGHVRYR